MEEKFWENKPLAEMTSQEWESLCDHCGLCCLVRLEDEDTGDLYETNVVCRHYDCNDYSCTSYDNRTQIEHGCIQLTPDLVGEFDWLPDSCAYRVVMRGEELPDTHPLKTGTNASSPVIADIQQQIGVVKDGPDIVHEHYLIASDASHF